ncbi:hypothetical protein DBADOPDK_03299 [Pseudomonas sp. MM223]|nr:hypothetical protein DBADOPDK_03299 [Pseudomonas sp. MM223]
MIHVHVNIRLKDIDCKINHLTTILFKTNKIPCLINCEWY